MTLDDATFDLRNSNNSLSTVPSHLLQQPTFISNDESRTLSCIESLLMTAWDGCFDVSGKAAPVLLVHAHLEHLCRGFGYLFL